MTYHLTAYKLQPAKVVHHQHLCTMAAVQRLTDLLAEEPNCDYITIRIIRPSPTPKNQPPLGL